MAVRTAEGHRPHGGGYQLGNRFAALAGGALALVRRLRSLIWAGLGLALYPRVTGTPPAWSWRG